ncbi:MAG: 50S ribosomal protein L11 methyltransferase [Cyanobacteriota bacterium]|nr:50S ribosomal protein L11 methyltransferase [Cyanobacteriota bacterium]
MGLSWWRLELAAPAELEESLLWKLPQLGIHRVALQHRPEAPQQRQLVAWLPVSDWPDHERLRLAEALEPLAATFGLELPPLHWQQQADEDWSLSWKQHWQPDPVGERLLILPAWLDCPGEHAQRLQIRMDPGSAFGTGSHPTTRLCLEALEGLAAGRGGQLGGLQVADLGCGSGVLGLAALRLGAAAVAAADTDSLAVRATGDNAALNGLQQQLQVVQGSASELALLLPRGPADLLLCNILAPVIEALSPSFAALLAPAGVGLLSGLLVEQAPRLQQVLAELGWQADLAATQGPWGLLVLHKAR